MGKGKALVQDGPLAKEASGLWYRPGTDDLATIKEATEVYAKVPIKSGDRVLDCGAHIGASVAVWRKKGAIVVAVEPERQNFRVLRENFGDDYMVDLIQAAVTPKRGMTNIFVNSGGTVFHTLVRTRGKQPQPVMGLRLDELAIEVNANVVKIDIEFGEHLLIPQILSLPEEVRVLAMEVHLQGKYRAAGMQLINDLEAQGWKPVAPYHITDRAWAVDICWER